jgi:hypothetical protein
MELKEENRPVNPFEKKEQIISKLPKNKYSVFSSINDFKIKKNREYCKYSHGVIK